MCTSPHARVTPKSRSVISTVTASRLACGLTIFGPVDPSALPSPALPLPAASSACCSPPPAPSVAAPLRPSSQRISPSSYRRSPRISRVAGTALRLSAGFRLLQDRNDLFFRNPLGFHRLLLVKQTLLPFRTKLGFQVGRTSHERVAPNEQRTAGAVSNRQKCRRRTSRDGELPYRVALSHTAPVAWLVRAYTPQRAQLLRTVGVISSGAVSGDSIPDCKHS